MRRFQVERFYGEPVNATRASNGKAYSQSVGIVVAVPVGAKVLKVTLGAALCYTSATAANVTAVELVVTPPGGGATLYSDSGAKPSLTSASWEGAADMTAVWAGNGTYTFQSSVTITAYSNPVFLNASPFIEVEYDEA